jgi:hypothetical protein
VLLRDKTKQSMITVKTYLIYKFASFTLQLSGASLSLFYVIGKTVDVPPLYVVDGTDTLEWDTKVLSPASEVVSSLLQVRCPRQVRGNVI